MRVWLDGKVRRYDIRTADLVAERYQDVRAGVEARNHVVASVCKWLSCCGKGAGYVDAAMIVFKRALDTNLDAFYWMRLRGSLGSALLLRWEADQGRSIDRLAELRSKGA